MKVRGAGNCWLAATRFCSNRAVPPHWHLQRARPPMQGRRRFTRSGECQVSISLVPGRGLVARSDLQPPTDHHTFILGEPGSADEQDITCPQPPPPSLPSPFPPSLPLPPPPLPSSLPPPPLLPPSLFPPSGHRFTVITLDGNPVPSPKDVDTLFLAPAERADVVVEMNRPGVWILGGIKDEDRKMGLGVVVEYANQRGEPQWSGPPDFRLGLHVSSAADRPCYPAPDERLECWSSKKSRAVAMATTAGPSMANPGRLTNPLFTTERGKRYRLAMTNKSGDNHPVHLHRHTSRSSRWATRRPRA